MSVASGTVCSSRHCRGLELELLQELARDARSLLGLDELDRRAALDDRAVKEPLRRRHREQSRHLTAAARLAEDRDVACVAAELRDVGADPLERVHDVEHADVAGLREVAAAELREMGEAEHVQAVVDGDDHDVAAAREVGAVGHG